MHLVQSVPALSPTTPRAGSFLPAALLNTPHQDVSTRFGRRLRELRRDHNMTQLRLAVEFGIDRTFISDVERGRKSISLPMLEILALGFQVSLSELLKGI